MVLDRILQKINQGKKQFVVLVDPEKANKVWLDDLLSCSEEAGIDMYFVGGSTNEGSVSEVVAQIKNRSKKDVVLFPGDVSQINLDVDAVLFLSLISGRNPEYLIGSHVKAAPLLLDMEVIPVSYVLIDGGSVSSTQVVSKTLPMNPLDIDDIVSTVQAGKMLGHRMVYLEAGSGAVNTIPLEIVSAVRQAVDIPLVVGGGIKTPNDISGFYRAGADIVVVGNALEGSFSIFSEMLYTC